MDGSSPVKHAGRVIKRGRGAGAASSSTRGGRGGAGAGATSSFKRKLAGTPLFRPPDDSDAAAATSEDSGEELPSLSEIASRSKPAAAAPKASKMAKDDGLNDAGAEKARKTRFETVATENRYLQVIHRSSRCFTDRHR